MAEIARGDDEWSTKEEDSRDGSEKEIEGKSTLPTMPVVEKEMDQVEHDVPTGNITYFEPKLYLQRYDYVINYIEKTKAKSVIDLGCAECKFVRELAKLQLKRVVGVDIQKELLVSNKFTLESNFDNFYLGNDFKREHDCSVELYQGNACEAPETSLQGIDFLSCIELIEHINEEDHPGLLKTIFRDIRPKTAIITTPNGDFNSHWTTMPHGNFRHDDHRFEWTREEFKKFTEHCLREYPEYSVKIEGIGKHWGGDYSKGFCSQSAVFTLKPYPSLHPERPLKSKYKQIHKTTLRKFDFKSMLYDAVLQILNTSADIPEPDEAQRHKSWTSPDEKKPAGAFTEEIGKYYRFPTGPQNWTDNDEDHCAQATIDTRGIECSNHVFPVSVDRVASYYAINRMQNKDKYDGFHIDYEYRNPGQYGSVESEDENQESDTEDSATFETVERSWEKEASSRSPAKSFSWENFEEDVNIDWRREMKKKFSTAVANWRDRRTPHQFMDPDRDISPADHFPVKSEKGGASLHALTKQFKLIKLFKKGSADDENRIDVLFDILLQVKAEGEDSLELYRDEDGRFKVTTKKCDRKRKMEYSDSSCDEAKESPAVDNAKYDDYHSDDDEAW